MEKYSVLMSVYKKENPDYLRISMNSIFNQSVLPDEFLLICDGPLTDALNNVISEFEKKYKNILRTIRFEHNMGLGYALQFGVKECKNNYIARMDSDDFSVPTRCEMQLKKFDEDNALSIVGSNIAEFSDNIDEINSIRKVPEKYSEIKNFIKKRNPFNHPSVMYKKVDVLNAGNYKNVRFMQDYFLWVDMISGGFKGYNIQENLVLMRANDNLFKRRSGHEYLKIQKELLKYMKNKNILNSFEYVFYLLIRSISSCLPNSIRKFLFKKVLRKKVVK